MKILNIPIYLFFAVLIAAAISGSRSLAAVGIGAGVTFYTVAAHDIRSRPARPDSPANRRPR